MLKIETKFCGENLEGKFSSFDQIDKFLKKTKTNSRHIIEFKVFLDSKMMITDLGSHFLFYNC